MNFDSNLASICDKKGHLLFYTNGIYVADSTNQPMLGGEQLLTDEFTLEHKKYGNPFPQNALILPCPDSDSLYYLLYKSIEYTPDYTDIVSKNLYYAIIDMSQNKGKGKVIIKNEILLGNVLQKIGNLTATRHANGRDWWMMINKVPGSEYVRFLITRKGIIKIGTQDLPPKMVDGLGQGVFSPDGTKFASVGGVRVTGPQYVNIYDFDRCQGLLSNHQQVLLPDTTGASGLAFSSNSRFLYVTMWTRIYQYDMQAADIVASKDTVATYDGFLQQPINNSSLFYLAQLAPDNKIYISIPSSSKYMHIIENPDLKGKACNVIQHGFQLPTYNANTIPNYPNFRLGKLEGVCDTIVEVVEQERERAGFKIYPNPASDLLNVKYTQSQDPLHLVLYDVLGKAVLTVSVAPNTSDTTLDVRTLSSGVYSCKLYQQGRVLSEVKVVMVR